MVSVKKHGGRSARHKLLVVCVVVLVLFAALAWVLASRGLPGTSSEVVQHRSHLFNKNARVDSRVLFKKCQVYLDWTHESGSDAFTYVNYKSLESALATYPSCRFEVMLVASQSANYYRIGNLISKHFFEKYSKKGYWVDVVVPGSKRYLHTNFDEYQYWTEEYRRCCTYTAKHFERDFGRSRGLPLHLYFFGRFASLAESGGIYTDFSWHHQYSAPLPIDRINQSMLLDGAAFITYCGSARGNLTTVCHTEAECHRHRYCHTSALMIFRPQSPIPQCVLHHYKDDGLNNSFLGCIRADSKTGGLYCVKRALQTCFETNRIANALLPGRNPFVPDYWVSGIVPPFDLWQVDGGIVGSSLNKISSNYSALWLGVESTAGVWTLPSPSSFLYSLIAQTRRVYAVTKDNVLRYMSNVNKCPKPPRPFNCSRYSLLQSGGEKMGLYSASQRSQAVVSCAPHFTIAGFMKAGTSFLYDSLTKHPQIIHALRGVVFKETGCYLPNSMTPRRAPGRMMCFPFLEKGDNIIMGDGTVYNAGGKDTPYHFYQDNPEIKVIFVVRQPVERAKSHHRFNFLAFKSFGLQNMNDMVDLALDSERGGLADLHHLATEAAAAPKASVQRLSLVTRLVDLYHGGIVRPCGSKATNMSSCDPKRYHRAANVVFHSLYFCAVWHWSRVVGKRNVLVVKAEDIDLRIQTAAAVDAQMARIHHFLRVCTWAPANHANLDFHVTLDNIQTQNRLNASNADKLQAFFHPFNQLLEDEVGVAY